MRTVFPGVADVLARPDLPVSMLIRLLLPTLLRPMKANSGKFPSGHCSTRALLMKYSADLIIVL